MGAQHCLLGRERLSFQQFGRAFGVVGHPAEPRVEQVEQGADAGQQEHRGQRDLDDVGDVDDGIA